MKCRQHVCPMCARVAIRDAVRTPGSVLVSVESYEVVCCSGECAHGWVDHVIASALRLKAAREQEEDL